MAKKASKVKIEEIVAPAREHVWEYEQIYYKDGKMKYMGDKKQKISKITSKFAVTHSGLKVRLNGDIWCMVL